MCGDFNNTQIIITCIIFFYNYYSFIIISMLFVYTYNHIIVISLKIMKLNFAVVIKLSTQNLSQMTFSID